jgi:hypothetical protein
VRGVQGYVVVAFLAVRHTTCNADLKSEGCA